MEQLILLADRGSLKAYRMDDSRLGGRPHIEEIEEIDVLSGHRRLGQITSDQLGRHSDHRGGPGAKQQSSTGEAHGLKREEERRAIAEIQKHIRRLLQEHPGVSWRFAAEESVNRRLLEGIDTSEKDRLLQNLGVDLVNQPKEEVRKRFSKGNKR